MATTEVKKLMATPFHILSPKNGMPIIFIVQDAMVSMYLLTKRKKQIERLMFMQYLVDLNDLSRFNEIVSKLGYTGKALFSFLLPRQLWHKKSKMQIENGLLMDGIIDKSSLGSSSLSVIKCIFVMRHRGLHNSLTSVSSWQIGTCCIMDIVLVSIII